MTTESEKPQVREVALPILPTDFKIVPLSDEIALMSVNTAVFSGLLAMDRGQCIDLGSKLISQGNSMPRPPAKLEVVEGIVAP